MYRIASCSFGKDSLAMVLRLIEENLPLDEVVFLIREWNLMQFTKREMKCYQY